jgi:ATP-dependent DNA helicase RecG
MEKAGTGIKRMTDSCDANGNKLNFDFTDSFWITIHSNQIVTDWVTDKVTDRVTGKVTDNQKMILESVIKQPYISTNELSVKVGISQRKIKENMAKLKEFGVLKRIGPAKGGYWEVIQE